MKKISEDKFFPDNPKWKEPYITYLGSIVKDGNEYDLGIWKSPKSTDMSWFFVQSNECGDYQSGAIFRNNKVDLYIFKSKYNEDSTLPVIETVIQASRKGHFKETVLHNFNFNIKYIRDSDVINFLLDPYKLKGINLRINKNFSLVKDDIIIKNPKTKWGNMFYHKGKVIDPFCIQLIEV